MLKRSKDDYDKLPPAPKKTEKLVYAIDKLFYLNSVDDFAGKLVQALGNPLFIEKIAARLTTIVPMHNARGLLISGGPSPGHRHLPEFLAIEAFRAKYQTHDWQKFFKTVFNKDERKKLRESSEADRIWHKYRDFNSDAALRLTVDKRVILEDKSQNTPQNFQYPLRNRSYDTLFKDAAERNLVILVENKSRLRAVLTAKEILPGYNIESMGFDGMADLGVIHWAESALAWRWVWSEVLRLDGYGYVDEADRVRKNEKDFDRFMKRRGARAVDFKPPFRFKLPPDVVEKLERVKIFSR